MKRRTKRIGALLVLCLGVLAGCVSTRMPEMTPEQAAEAERLFREGVEAQATFRKVDELRSLKAAAELGHVVAMAFYAEACEADYHPEQSAEEAERWRERAEALAEPKAQAGDAEAQFAISVIASQKVQKARNQAVAAGRSFGEDAAVQAFKKEQEVWILRSAEGGYDLAQLELGNKLAIFGDWGKDEAMREEGKTWLRKAAEKGNTYAMVALGQWAYDDHPEEAQAWFRKAMDLGSTEAMTVLGRLLREEDEVEARKAWWLKAAEQGNTLAMLWLSGLYEKEGNLAEAEKWLNQAEEQAPFWVRRIREQDAHSAPRPQADGK